MTSNFEVGPHDWACNTLALSVVSKIGEEYILNSSKIQRTCTNRKKSPRKAQQKHARKKRSSIINIIISSIIISFISIISIINVIIIY